MILTQNDRLFVLTGAGVSAESGLATFRGSGGLWNGYRVDQVATPEAWHADPELVWRFYPCAAATPLPRCQTLRTSLWQRLSKSWATVSIFARKTSTIYMSAPGPTCTPYARQPLRITLRDL